MPVRWISDYSLAVGVQYFFWISYSICYNEQLVNDGWVLSTLCFLESVAVCLYLNSRVLLSQQQIFLFEWLRIVWYILYQSCLGAFDRAMVTLQSLPGNTGLLYFEWVVARCHNTTMAASSLWYYQSVHMLLRSHIHQLWFMLFKQSVIG